MPSTQPHPSCRHLLAVSVYQESTTAMPSFMELQPAASEDGVCSQHCCQDCSAAAKVDQSHTITASAPLAVSLTVDHIQVSCADVQDQPQSNTCLPQTSHHSAHLWVHSALLYSSAVVRTILHDYFLGMSFALHCSYHLELYA